MAFGMPIYSSFRRSILDGLIMSHLVAVDALLMSDRKEADIDKKILTERECFSDNNNNDNNNIT